MALKLNKIEINQNHKHLRIKEITDDGGFHRRVLTPDMTLAEDEHQEVKDKAEELWTDEVKSAWATFKEEQNKEQT